MKYFRTSAISKVFTVCTAIAFLNMGFFLSEVKMLQMEVDRDLVENIAELILNVGMEEERDIGGDLPDEKSIALDDFFLSPFHTTDSMLYVLAHLRKWNHGADAIRDYGLDKVTPPPEA